MGIAMMAGAGMLAEGETNFSPTITGRQSVNGLLSHSIAEDEAKGQSDASADNDIWIYAHATDIEIRINTFTSPNDTEMWWNDSSVEQGEPGSDEVIFQLGERSGVTCNIYTVSVDLPTDMTHAKLVSNFTDDNQVSFFSPTNTVRYGYRYDADAGDPSGESDVLGTVVHKFTFRKAGFTDFVIQYSQYSDAIASDYS